MPADTRSTSEIERDIERERSQLGETLDELQDRFSVDGVFQEARHQFDVYGSEIGSAILRQVRENPLALAVAGAGIAWLIFGNERAPRRRVEYRDVHRFSDTDDEGYDVADPGFAGRSGYVEDRYARYRTSGSAGSVHDDSPDWARPTPTPPGYYGSADEDDFGDYDSGPSWRDRASAARGRASGAAHSAEARAAGAAGAARDRASAARHAAGERAHELGDRARSAGSGMRERVEAAGTGLSRRARDARHRGRDLRYRIAAGTEHLSEEARARVIAARERAIDAQQEAGRYLSRGRDSAVDFFEEQPLVTGALAMAVGAAIAGALPRTRTEDDYFGSYRDELVDEAERIFREETAKARAVADAAAEEARDIAQEKRDEADAAAPGQKSAAQAAADEAKDAAARVGETAREEAENQHLGKPNA